MKEDRKNQFHNVRFTKKQSELLKERATKAGFRSICEYIRFQVLLPATITEKIDKIYQKMCDKNE